MNRFDIPEDTFIGGWFMPENIIDEINDYFDSMKHKLKPGTQGRKKINKDVKESLDLGVDFNDYEPPFLEYRKSNQHILDNYLNVFKRANENDAFGIKENINIQHYPVGGGFKIWHHENKGSLPIGRDRHLTFMTYLNDVDDGGTEFLYQKITIPAKKGLTIVWPTQWTHTHRGQISHTKEKRIITGWYNFI
tara:strand:- start:68 stop:643 length:576 start_codon:yes stop_codon:yes gene_type:complete